MRVLMLTRRVDRIDSRMGFTHTWIERLAQHPVVEMLDVICLELGEYALPENVTVTSMGKERGKNRLREFWNFQRAIRPLIRRVDVIFGHMIPRYVLVAAPWAKLFGVPMALWYTHKSITTELKIAHALVDRVVTASAESFQLPSNKVTVIGHGIDMVQFTPAESIPAGDPLILAVGRLSPVKNYDVLIRAFARLVKQGAHPNLRLGIAGGTPERDQFYAGSLKALADELGIADRVDFLGPVPHEEIPARYRQAALTVNLCPTGGMDKVVIESLACGVPALVHNETFLPLLDDDHQILWSESLDPEQVARKLGALLALPPADRVALGKRLSGRVHNEYNLTALINRLVAVFSDIIG